MPQEISQTSRPRDGTPTARAVPNQPDQGLARSDVLGLSILAGIGLLPADRQAVVRAGHASRLPRRDPRPARRRTHLRPDRPAVDPALGRNPPALRRAGNTAKPQVAPSWAQCLKEAYNTDLDSLARALGNWPASRTGRRAGARVGFPGSSRASGRRHRYGSPPARSASRTPATTSPCPGWSYPHPRVDPGTRPSPARGHGPHPVGDRPAHRRTLARRSPGRSPAPRGPRRSRSRPSASTSAPPAWRCCRPGRPCPTPGTWSQGQDGCAPPPDPAINLQQYVARSGRETLNSRGADRETTRVVAGGCEAITPHHHSHGKTGTVGRQRPTATRVLTRVASFATAQGRQPRAGPTRRRPYA